MTTTALVAGVRDRAFAIGDRRPPIEPTQRERSGRRSPATTPSGPAWDGSGVSKGASPRYRGDVSARNPASSPSEFASLQDRDLAIS